MRQAIKVAWPFPPLARKIIAAAYPSYRGRKLQVRVADGPIDVRSYWDGGSRDYFVFVNTAGEVQRVPAQSGFDRPIAGAEAVTLPPNVVCVEHSIFCGKDLGITIHLPAEAAPLWIEGPAESVEAR